MPSNGKPEIPVVGSYGINSGVLFLELNKLREFEFDKKMMNLLDIYMEKLFRPEQDLLNILFANQTGRW
jgi:lipopolysaccharide biosynthesis glycosyltransferase